MILYLQLNTCVHICNLICICILFDRNTGGVVEVAEPGIVEAPATERRVWCSFLAECIPIVFVFVFVFDHLFCPCICICGAHSLPPA